LAAEIRLDYTSHFDWNGALFQALLPAIMSRANVTQPEVEAAWMAALER
jgi:hypothetical protein